MLVGLPVPPVLPAVASHTLQLLPAVRVLGTPSHYGGLTRYHYVICSFSLVILSSLKPVLSASKSDTPALLWLTLYVAYSFPFYGHCGAEIPLSCDAAP